MILDRTQEFVFLTSIPGEPDRHQDFGSIAGLKYESEVWVSWHFETLAMAQLQIKE